MLTRREFDLPFVGLNIGEHRFDYSIDKAFFKKYDNTELEHCKAEVVLTLNKHPNFMQLKFEIDGSFETLCDRCGNELHPRLWDEFNVIVKMVENPTEMNEQEEDVDIFYISKYESHLYLSDWIYEFVILSIPNQNYCGITADGKSLCNPKVLKKLKELQNSSSSTNPIWSGLEKLKEKK